MGRSRKPDVEPHLQLFGVMWWIPNYSSCLASARLAFHCCSHKSRAVGCSQQGCLFFSISYFTSFHADTLAVLQHVRLCTGLRQGLKYVRTTTRAFITSHVIVGMDSTNPRPRMPGSIPWYWPQRASNRVLDRSNTRCNAEYGWAPRRHSLPTPHIPP